MTKALLTRPARLFALTMCLSAHAAFADPITVTSGQFYFPDDEPGFFSLLGANGLVIGGGFVSQPFRVVTVSPQIVCLQRGCQAGTSLSLTTVLGDGTGFFLSTSQGLLTGSLRFDAPAIVLPPFDGSPGIGFTAPFVFSGDVTGFSLRDVEARVPLFHADLTGRGTVRAIFDDPHPPFYPNPEVTYTFAATPEPGTFALVTFSVFGIVARTKLRKCRGQGVV